MKKLFAKAAHLFDVLVHDTFEQAFLNDYPQGISIDSPEWLKCTLASRDGGLGLTPIARVMHAAYLGSQLQMLQYDVVGTYGAESAPVYNNLDVVGGAGSTVKADFVASWDHLWQLLGDKFATECLGAATDERTGKEPDLTPYHSPACLYPTDTDGKDSPCLGVVGSRTKKWQSTISRALQDKTARDFFRLDGTAEASDELMCRTRSSQLPGGTAIFTACPVEKAYELSNDAFVASLCHALAIEDHPTHSFESVVEGVPQRCPLVSGKGGTKCDEPLDAKHLAMCRVKINGPSELHDGMMRAFWYVETKALGFANHHLKEKRGLCANASRATRPADTWWTRHPQTAMQGFDYACTDSTSCRKQRLAARMHGRGGIRAAGYSKQAQETGCNAAGREADKLKKLKELTLLAGNNAADVILPLVCETTGGLGKSARRVLVHLSKVAHPGDDEDKELLRRRSIWRTRLIKRHSFALARTRHDLMVNKRDLIRDVLIRRGAPSSVLQSSLLSKARTVGGAQRRRARRAPHVVF